MDGFWLGPPKVLLVDKNITEDQNMMKQPVLLIEVIETAQKYDAEIHIAKDCDRFYAYVLGRGYTRNFWMSANQLEKDIRVMGFSGMIKVD
jgi:hypothetical protein